MHVYDHRLSENVKNIFHYNEGGITIRCVCTLCGQIYRYIQIVNDMNILVSAYTDILFNKYILAH